MLIRIDFKKKWKTLSIIDIQTVSFDMNCIIQINLILGRCYETYRNCKAKRDMF